MLVVNFKTWIRLTSPTMDQFQIGSILSTLVLTRTKWYYPDNSQHVSVKTSHYTEGEIFSTVYFMYTRYQHYHRHHHNPGFNIIIANPITVTPWCYKWMDKKGWIEGMDLRVGEVELIIISL